MRDKIALRVIKGGLVPANTYARDQLRERGFKVNNLIYADLIKARNPRFNRLVHAIGKMVSQNIEGFPPDAHAALKKLQLEGNIACDTQAMEIPGVGECLVRLPKSLAFHKMDEGEFHQVAQAMCRYIAETYWPTMTPEQIEQMAERLLEQI